MSGQEAIKQAGLGLGRLSSHTLEVELMPKRLVGLDVEGFPNMRYGYSVHRQGKRFSAVAEAFKPFVLAGSQSLLSMPLAEITA